MRALRNVKMPKANQEELVPSGDQELKARKVKFPGPPSPSSPTYQPNTVTLFKACQLERRRQGRGEKREIPARGAVKACEDAGGMRMLLS